MDANSIQAIYDTMEHKPTEELKQILQEANRAKWSDEAFVAIKRVLSDRESEINRLSEWKRLGDVNSIIRLLFEPRYLTIGAPHDRLKELAKLIARTDALSASKILVEHACDRSLDESKRRNAIYVLGKIASPDTTGRLISLLFDRAESIREAAHHALQKIDDPKAERASIKFSSFRQKHTRLKKGVCSPSNYWAFVIGGIGIPLFLSGGLFFVVSSKFSSGVEISELGYFVLSVVLSALTIVLALRKDGTISIIRYVIFLGSAFYAVRSYSEAAISTLFIPAGIGGSGLFILCGLIGVGIRSLTVHFLRGGAPKSLD